MVINETARQLEEYAATAMSKTAQIRHKQPRFSTRSLGSRMPNNNQTTHFFSRARIASMDVIGAGHTY